MTDITAQTTDDVWTRLESQASQRVEELCEFLRIPSVSTDPAYAEEVWRAARFLKQRLRTAGLQSRLIEGRGYPLVYAEWLGAPGAPTLLYYGHYDVQPPEPLDEWTSPPFEPTIREGRIVARGATDDKGQIYLHVAAVSAMLEERGSLPVNVKFLIEGEEESGGQAIEHFVRQDAGELLGCDAVIVSDSSMFAPGVPSVLYGLRGLLYTELRVTGPDRDLHSGTFGGAVVNPANALAEIIARLRDTATGRVAIPRFYDDVRPLEDWERGEFAALPYDEAAYRAAIGVPGLGGEHGYSTFERAWARPTCDVNGLTSGYQGAGAKTIIPAKASAKVSMRLVPDQDPNRIASALREFAREVAPAGVNVELEVLSRAPATLIEPRGPMFEAAEAALEEVWGRRPVRVREGGSIPIVATFAEALGVPVLLLGFGLSDDRLHAPNEKFDLAQFFGGMRTSARLLDLAGQRARDAGRDATP